MATISTKLETTKNIDTWYPDGHYEIKISADLTENPEELTGKIKEALKQIKLQLQSILDERKLKD
ncbi:MAG: hypothetical protein IJP69_06925 [Synergistaceae bacterium]|nr:hypothetical protein [Synergistaceae bacterium]